MPAHRGPRIDATILGAASLLALAMGGSTTQSLQVGTTSPPAIVTEGVAASDLVGGWTNADGTVKLKVGTDNRYERSVAGRDKISRGTYRIDGTKMTLRDDSGLLTIVTIYDNDTLDMAGHRLHHD
jgi:hypothetical protein